MPILELLIPLVPKRLLSPNKVFIGSWCLERDGVPEEKRSKETVVKCWPRPTGAAF